MGNDHTYQQWYADRIHATNQAEHERRQRQKINPPQTDEEILNQTPEKQHNESN